MEFFQCMSLNKARECVIDSLAGINTGSEQVPLMNALGRIVSQDMVATEDLPPFSRSTVDGFAVRSGDTFGASETAPALFVVVGEITMGNETKIQLQPGQATLIPTGGMVPAGADGIVMLEYTEQYAGNMVMVLKKIAPGENLVRKGDDMQGGQVVVKKGQRLAPQHIGALAACGFSTVSVTRRLEVGIFSTGDELVAIHEPAQYGQIRDVNSYTLGAMLTEIGCVVRAQGIIKDSFEEFLLALQNGVQTCQMVVISGGSSVGTRDYTEKAMNALGKPGVFIHGIAMKPGKPTIFGMVGKVPVFGLPGHPVAAMTVCEHLVKVAVHSLVGQEIEDTFHVSACLARNLPSVPGRDDFVNVRLSKQEGEIVANPILGKSGLINTMTQSHGMVHILEGQSGLYNGEMVEVVLSQKAE